MKRAFRLPVFLSLAFMLLLAAASAPSTQQPDYPALENPEGPYAVVEVIDGDTIKVNTYGGLTTFRLIGVDTPETVDPRKPVQEYGHEASAFTHNLLAGEMVWLTYDPSNLTDKYQRSLAFVWRVPDGMLVNLEIVRQGYGHALTEYPNPYMDTFRAYEARAREAGKGLWADSELPEGTAYADGDPFPDTRHTYAWPELTGEDETQQEPQEDADDGVLVHITDTGTKYHRAGCRSLSKSDYTISLADAKAQGYTPCSVCDPPR